MSTEQERRIERITSMEASFEEAERAIEAFESALNAFERAQPAIARMSDYYGSAEWFEDVDSHAAGELPPDLKCGILGEDLPYEALVTYHDLAIRMLEAAIRALK